MMDYAQLTLPHESIGISPHQLILGSEPATTWDWKSATKGDLPISAKEKLSREEAIALATRIHDAWEFAKTMMEKAQDNMQKSAANKKRRSVDWNEKS